MATLNSQINTTNNDEPPPPPADVLSVLNAIRGCTSPDTATRRPAEELLQQWERSPQPGYLTSLLAVVSGDTNVTTGVVVSADLRLLAAILAKNSVPHIWGWSIADDEGNGGAAAASENAQALQTGRSAERAAARSALLSLLFREPDDRVALHLRLALANVGLFDFPQQWPSLLEDLVTVASGSSSFASSCLAGTDRVRAIRAVRDVLQAVRHRKLVVKDGQGGPRGLVDLGKIFAEAAEGRRRSSQQAATVLGPLMSGAIGHARSLLAAAGPGWDLEGTLCVGYLKSMAELLPMIAAASDKSREIEVAAFLEQAAMILEETKSYQLPCPVGVSMVGAGGFEAWTRLVDKVHRATLLCCGMAIMNMPQTFAPYVPRCLECIVGAMLGLDEAALQALPVKRLVAHTSFVKCVLSCRLYDPHQTAASDRKSILALLMDQHQAPAPVDDTHSNGDPNLTNARNAVAGLLGEGLCENFVQVIVTKFIRLSEEEAAEWDSDPEGRFETVQAERNMMEAETPRHCGGILLAVMMSREETRVGQALLDLTRQICQQPPDDLVGLLHREACYRALEICQPWMQGGRLNFADWWDAEIRALLQSSLGPQHPVPMRALQARAVEVVEVYRTSIREQDFSVAFQAVAQLLAAPDLVTSLHAARCLNLLALLQVKGEEETPQLMAVREHSVFALGNAFALANRVTSEECLRTTLLLVSGLVEANGTSLEHCLHAIAEQLPPLWERAGESVPIHSCLVAVLHHLIMKIGYTAVENAHVQKVLFPLVDYCTDISATNRAETLLEDGLKLWLATLITSRMAAMASSLATMLPRLEAILRSGLESHLSLKVLQFYAILMGSQVIEPLTETLRTLLLDCTACVHAGPTDAGTDRMDEDQESRKAGTVKDCIAALNFSDALLQLFPSLGYSVCYPSLSKVLAALPGRSLPVPLLEGAFGALARLLWFRPSALEEIFADDEDQDKHIAMIVRTWLQIASGPSLFVAFIPHLRTAKFIDQKEAALSLCAAVCQSPKLARLVGQTVLEFTKALQEVERNLKLNIDALVEATCGTARKVVGDGPLGDSASRTGEILKADPLLTVNLKDALDRASNAVNASAPSL